MFAKIVKKVQDPVVIKVASSLIGAVAGLVVAILVTNNTEEFVDDVPFNEE
jgi:hypothetical protein